MQRKQTILFERDGNWWVATSLTLPGAFSQGKTIEEVRANLLDAMREMREGQQQLEPHTSEQNNS
jgi:predicted RNase H-like HicB family nuclease